MEQNQTENVANLNKDILKPLRQMSLIFFTAIGLAHIISGLMASNNMYTDISNLTNRILDIPFAVIAIIFAFSHIRISEKSNKKTALFIVMTVISLLVIGLLLYINLFIPDKIQ